jgi:hypothetical protein
MRALLDRLLFSAGLRIAKDRADDIRVRAHVAADHHVLERREVGEQPDVLKVRAMRWRNSLSGPRAAIRRT